MYSKGQNKPHKKHQPDSDSDQYQNQSFTLFSSLQKKNVLTLAQYDPKRHYLTVYPGLNFRGKCPKQGCKAFNQPTWVKKGYGKFDVAQVKHDCFCPCCNTKLKFNTVTTFGYTKAQVFITGMKLIGEEGQDQESQPYQMRDIQKIGKFVTFEDSKEDLIKWGFLKIQVKQPSN